MATAFLGFIGTKWMCFSIVGVSCIPCACVLPPLLFAAGFVIPAIIATLIFIGAGIVATFLGDDNVDKWLKRCYWGVLDANDRYRNVEMEIKELSIATGS